MALTEYVIMPGEDYQAICDAVRAKTGKTEVLKSGDLSAEVAQIEVDDGSKEQLRKLVDGTIESYVFPEGTTEVRDGLFHNCKNLTSVRMHEGITKIGQHSFGYTEKIQLESLPNSITSIDFAAFIRSNVSIEALPSNLTYLGAESFSGTPISISNLPKTLTQILGYTFQNCNNILEINIPANIIKIYFQAFYNCGSLTQITFEGGPSLDASNIFGNCTALKNVTFEGTPPAMSTSVFSGCNALTTINVPWSEGEVAGAPWGATNATINYNYVEPILWEIGYSCYGVSSDNKIIRNGYAANRASAYQTKGQFKFSINGTNSNEEIYPIKIPYNAKTLTVTVPEELLHGVIFWKCNELEDTTMIKDYGWNGNSFTYDLSNYEGATHITINIKKPDNSDIEYTGDFSDFHAAFGTE